MEQFVKPAIALWRAGIFFLIGIVLEVISTIWHPPYADIAQGNRLWYHDIVDKAVGSVDNIAHVIFFAGLIYAILVALGEFLWTSKLEDSSNRGFQTMSDALTIGSARMSHNSVLKWVTNIS